MGDDKYSNPSDRICVCGHHEEVHATKQSEGVLACSWNECECIGFTVLPGRKQEQPCPLCDAPLQTVEGLITILKCSACKFYHVVRVDGDLNYSADVVNHWKGKYGEAEAAAADLRGQLDRADRCNTNQAKTLRAVYKALHDKEPTLNVGITRMPGRIRELRDDLDRLQNATEDHDSSTGEYFICCKNQRGEFVHYKVSASIYLYIHQLEGAVRDPDNSKIREAYPDRFKQRKEANRHCIGSVSDACDTCPVECDAAEEKTPPEKLLEALGSDPKRLAELLSGAYESEQRWARRAERSAEEVRIVRDANVKMGEERLRLRIENKETNEMIEKQRRELAGYQATVRNAKDNEGGTKAELDAMRNQEHAICENCFYQYGSQSCSHKPPCKDGHEYFYPKSTLHRECVTRAEWNRVCVQDMQILGEFSERLNKLEGEKKTVASHWLSKDEVKALGLVQATDSVESGSNRFQMHDGEWYFADLIDSTFLGPFDTLVQARDAAVIKKG